jgi:microcystin-dependent protein
MALRDIIQGMVDEELEKQRPRYRYATVVSIDNVNGKCDVIYTGESGTVTVNMGAIRPTAANQSVRIEGIGTDKFITDVIGGIPPDPVPTGIATSGFVNPFAGAAAPNGWLLCDGSAVSRTTYAALYGVISTSYGAGDGSTTFNLPDLRGRMPAGKDATQTEFDTLGEAGGAKSHSHPLSDAGQAAVAVAARTTNQIVERRVSSAPYATTHTINSSGLGGGATGLVETDSSGAALLGNTDSTATLPPYQVVNYIIKI